MNRQSASKGLIALLVLTLLAGVVGGGVVGGVAGLYAASNPAARASFPANAQYVSSKTTTGQHGVTTNLTVNQDSAIIDTVKKAEPAVVTVINTLQANSGQQSGRRQNPLGPTNPADPNNPSGPTAPFGSGGAVAEGSGVIIDGQGHIITNNHVVDGASKLDVVFSDGTKKRHSSSAQTRSAILQCCKWMAVFPHPLPLVIPTIYNWVKPRLRLAARSAIIAVR